MNEEFKELPISDIHLDRKNPRIQRALDKYGDDITAQRLHLALMGGGDKNPQASFDRLSTSIKSNGGIKIPIIVRSENGSYICTEGNTRLSIYTDFNKNNVEGNWEHIPCLVSENPSSEEVEITRMTSHLVPARQWPAYEKASYLHELRYEKLFDFEKMIEICGGNRVSIERSMAAYIDMNKFYRDRIDDAAFDPFRFSGFEELQKPGVKECIWNAGFELTHFGDWIINGNITRLENVRLLKKVLQHPEGKEIFINGGVNSIKKANLYIDMQNIPSSDILLRNATIYQLVGAATKKIADLSSDEIQQIKKEDNFIEIENFYDSFNETFFSDNE